MQCTRQLLTRKIPLAKARRQINFLNRNVERSQNNDKSELNSGILQRKAIFKRPVIKIPILTQPLNDHKNSDFKSIFDESNRDSILSASKSRKNLSKGLLAPGDPNTSFWEQKPYNRQAEWLFPQRDRLESIDDSNVIQSTDSLQDIDKNEIQSFPIFIKEVLSKIPDSPELESSLSDQISSLKSQYKSNQGISPDSIQEAQRMINYYPGIERKERMNEVESYRLATFESLIEDGRIDNNTIDLLIKQRALDGKLSDCLDILNKMKIYGLHPSVQTYNNVLLCTCTLRNPKSARFIYLKMIAESITPDLKTFSILIKTHVMAKDLNSAFALQRKMEKDGISSDVVVFSTLIDGLVNNGYLDRAWETFNYARTWRLIEPDQVLFTIMIKACYKKGKVERALNLYEEMVSLGLHPTDLTFITLIKAMSSRRGFLNDAFHFYNLMKCQEMPMSRSVYQHLLKCCGRNGVYSRAEMVLNEYKNAGFQLQEIDLYHLIMSMKSGIKVKGVNIIRKAFDIIKSASDDGVCIGSITLNGLIDLYQSAGFYKYAVQVLELFPHFNVEPNNHTYTILLTFLGMDLKEPGMFFNLWKLMRDKGIVPSRKLMCLALDVALISGSSKMTLNILGDMYNLRVFPTPNLVSELYKRGKHIVEIHLAIKDLEQLQRSLVEQRCKRDSELLQTYIDERQLSSYLHGKKLNHQTTYHKFRSKIFKQFKEVL